MLCERFHETCRRKKDVSEDADLPRDRFRSRSILLGAYLFTRRDGGTERTIVLSDREIWRRIGRRSCES
jgi:hypothetical protein